MVARLFMILFVPLFLSGLALADISTHKSRSIIEELKLFDVWVQHQMSVREQPGLSIGIVFDGALIWNKSYGYSELGSTSPATSKTMYRIASISKTFTATAILQLRDSGKLKLSDPVEAHLPWFKIQTDDSDPIQIWHLLTHTSGLPREPVDLDWGEFNYPSRDSMIRNLEQQKTVFSPETEWKYSNLAFALAGEIVSAVSGMAWETYVEKNILDPLGMMDTTVVPKDGMGNLAAGYARKSRDSVREPLPWVDTLAIRPAANMASTVEDLAQYVAFHLSADDDVLWSSSKREMHRVHWLLDSWEQGWGLGFRVTRRDGFNTIGHGGLLPGHYTDIDFSPTLGLGVIVLSNSVDGEPRLYSNMIFDLLSEVLAEGKDVHVEGPVSELEKYTGTYSNAFDIFTVLQYDGALVSVPHGSASPAKSLICLEAKGAHRFAAHPEGFSYTNNGQIFEFQFEGTGNATSVTTDYATWTRLPD